LKVIAHNQDMVTQATQLIPNRKLRIALECRIDDPFSGVGSAILSLADALSRSDIQGQEYTFIVHESAKKWLEPHIFGPCRLVAIPKPQPSQLKRILRRLPPLQKLWHRLKSNFINIPASDGFVESNRFDLVHFVSPTAYSTSCPAIYQPWDLQHLHYPEFFSKIDFALRERWYREFCKQAEIICVQAEWTKDDFISHYDIPAEKIQVIPWGSVFEAYKEPSEQEVYDTVRRYSLPSKFFFYPAVTWIHKNHEIILRSLQILKREHGAVPHVYFTGSSTDHRSTLDNLAIDLGVSEQVHFLGFVTATQLQSIYRVATAMLFPSKFEGFGLPILEAFHARLPVLSSNATTLPEVARNGALYFNPDSPAELSGLMKRILDSEELRQDLTNKGSLVLSQCSMERTAAEFQRLYDRAAVSLTLRAIQLSQNQKIVRK
jgi:glycosyltransferase involved in cell wall biosynthesis